MIGLLQRVRKAAVSVEGETIAAIGRGCLAFIAVEQHDGETQAARLTEKLLAYRMFADAQGKMNLSLTDTNGALLLVSQFTLAADTSKGLRPGFSRAAEPQAARYWFEYLCQQVSASGLEVAIGRFGADMQVSLVNDGPVTFYLQV